MTFIHDTFESSIPTNTKLNIFQSMKHISTMKSIINVIGAGNTDIQTSTFCTTVNFNSVTSVHCKIYNLLKSV
jgi:hypothetical protein